jgi:FSR family fosmidomycin resistance protein-like MFS transporter
MILGLMGISLTGIGAGLSQAFWQMVPCFIAMGLVGGTYHAPASSFISQNLPPNKRGRGLGLHVVGGSASFFLTPAMALSIATLFSSWRASFLILALPSLVIGALLWLTTPHLEEDAKPPKKSKPDATGQNTQDSSLIGSKEEHLAWSEIIRSIGFIACLTMSLQIVFSSVDAYLPLYMVDRHNISPKWAGMVISIIAAAAMFGAPLGGALSDRFGRKQLILFSLCLSGPLLYAITKSPYGIFLLMSLLSYGLALSARMPVMESLIADVVPVGRRTTVLGIFFFLGMETAGIITPIVGWLIDMHGLEAVFSGLSTGLCLVAAIALVFRKKL